MDISIIIVSWNVRDLLKKCLESIYKYSLDVSFEVFVVDNHSSDGSPAMVRADFPQAVLIENFENLGFAAANNQALAECSGRYVLFLNPDTELVDNSIRAMTLFMDAHPDASALGCKLIYPDGSLQHSCRRFPSIFTDLMESLHLDELFPENRILNYYRMGLKGYDTTHEVDQPAGACLLIRRAVFEKVGILDERFFIYFEEVDLCRRIKKAGGKILFTPDITVVHIANKSTGQVYAESRRYYIRSKLLFFEKHYGKFSIIFAFFDLVIRSILDLSVLPIAHLITGHPKKIYLASVKDGLRIFWDIYLKFILRGLKLRP